MATHNSPAPASGGATPPTPTSHEELAVSGFHESDLLRTATSTVEEDFLRNALGVVIERDAGADHGILGNEIAHAVSQRVFTVIDKTRSAVDTHGLDHLLEHRLQEALARINIDARHNRLLAVNDTLHARRVRAVCEAIRESLPAAVMNDVIRYGLPAFVPENANLPEHVVVVECEIKSPRYPGSTDPVGTCRVEIDTRNYFWRQDHDKQTVPPTNIFNDLQAALITKRQTFSALGIRIVPKGQPLPESFRLDQTNGVTDIKNILDAVSGGIDVSQRYENITVVQGSVHFAIDTAKIVRYRDNTGKLVASMNHTELLTELQKSVTDSDIWDYIMVEPQGILPNLAMCTAIADQLFAHFDAVPTDSLAIDDVPLWIIQREIAEQHRFFEQMREGSDNYWGAALATSLLMKHKDLRDVVKTRSESDIKADIKTQQDNLSLVQKLTELESLSPPAGAGSWAELDWKELDIERARDDVLTMASPGLIYIGFGATLEEFDVPEDPKIKGAPDRDAANSWLSKKNSELRRSIQAYDDMFNKFNAMVNAISSITGKTTGLIIHDYWTFPGSADKTKFASTMDMRALTQDIRDQCDLNGKDRAAVASDLQKYQKELLAGAEKPITGAEAQHRVISGELMRYHGLTEQEARDGTTALRTRSLLDTDVAQSTERFANSLHEESEAPHGRVAGFIHRYVKPFPEDLARFDIRGSRDRTLIQNIAHSCHIPQNTAHEPLWSQTQFYDDLITAYHALDKLKKQKLYDRNSDVPFGVRIREQAGLDRAMREISRALFMQHAKGVLQFYGPSVGLKDGDVERILAEPKKLELERILQKVLSSPPNADTAHKVSHAIEHAVKRTQPAQRFLSSTLFGKDWGMITGSRNKVSAHSLILGNKYASAVGAGKGIAAGAKLGWQRKWGVAAGAALGFVALGPLAPVGILAGGILGGKFLFKPKSGGGPAH